MMMNIIVHGLYLWHCDCGSFFVEDDTSATTVLTETLGNMIAQIFE